MRFIMKLLLAMLCGLIIGTIISFTLLPTVLKTGVFGLSAPNDAYGGPLKPVGYFHGGIWSYECGGIIPIYSWTKLTTIETKPWIVKVSFVPYLYERGAETVFVLHPPLYEKQRIDISKKYLIYYGIEEQPRYVEEYVDDFDSFEQEARKKLHSGLMRQLELYYLDHKGPDLCGPQTNPFYPRENAKNTDLTNFL